MSKFCLVLFLISIAQINFGAHAAEIERLKAIAAQQAQQLQQLQQAEYERRTAEANRQDRRNEDRMGNQK